MTDDISTLLQEGDEVIEQRAHGFTVNRIKMFEKMAAHRTTDNQTSYIYELLDFAMQNNAGRVDIAAKPKRFEIAVDGVGLSKKQAEMVIALAFQPIVDERFSKYIGLSRGIAANLGNRDLSSIVVDTMLDQEGQRFVLYNILGAHTDGKGARDAFAPETHPTRLSRNGIKISVNRKKADRRKPRSLLGIARRTSWESFFDLPVLLRPSVEYETLKGAHFYTDVAITLNGRKISSAYDLPEASLWRRFKRNNVEGVVGIPDRSIADWTNGRITLARNGIEKEIIESGDRSYSDVNTRLLSANVSAIINSSLFSQDLSGARITKNDRFLGVLDAVGEEVLVLYQDLMRRYRKESDLEYKRVVQEQEYSQTLHDKVSAKGRVPFYYRPHLRTRWYRSGREQRMESDREELIRFLCANLAPEQALGREHPLVKEMLQLPIMIKLHSVMVEEQYRTWSNSRNNRPLFLTPAQTYTRPYTRPTLSTLDEVLTEIEKNPECFDVRCEIPISTSEALKGPTIVCLLEREKEFFESLVELSWRRKQSAVSVAPAASRSEFMNSVIDVYGRIQARFAGAKAQLQERMPQIRQDVSKYSRTAGAGVIGAAAIGGAALLVGPVITGVTALAGGIAGVAASYGVPILATGGALGAVYGLSRTRLVRSKNGKPSLVDIVGDAVTGAFRTTGETAATSVASTTKFISHRIVRPAARQIGNELSDLIAYTRYRIARPALHAIGRGIAAGARYMAGDIAQTYRDVRAAGSVIGRAIGKGSSVTYHKMLTPLGHEFAYAGGVIGKGAKITWNGMKGAAVYGVALPVTFLATGAWKVLSKGASLTSNAAVEMGGGLGSLIKRYVASPLYESSGKLGSWLRQNREARAKSRKELEARTHDEARDQMTQYSRGIRRMISVMQDVMVDNGGFLNATLMRDEPSRGSTDDAEMFANAVGIMPVHLWPSRTGRSQPFYFLPCCVCPAISMSARHQMREHLVPGTELSLKEDRLLNATYKTCEAYDVAMPGWQPPAEHDRASDDRTVEEDGSWRNHYVNNKNKHHFFLNLSHPRTQQLMQIAQSAQADDPLFYQMLFGEMMRSLQEYGAEVQWGIGQPKRYRYVTREDGGVSGSGNNGAWPNRDGVWQNNILPRMESVEVPYDTPAPVALQTLSYADRAKDRLMQRRVRKVMRMYEGGADEGGFEAEYLQLRPEERMKIISELYEQPENPKLLAVVERNDMGLVQEVGRKTV
jgi:hypothetical protein